jgi:hypothetical protein
VKKFLTVLTLILAVCSCVFAKPHDDRELVLKFGFQPQSIMTLSNKDHNMDLSASGGVEFFQYFGNILALGGGVAYDISRNFQDKNTSGSASFLPIFLAAKIRTPLHGLDNNYVFLSPKAGLSIPMTKDFANSTNTGLYYGVGLGVSINVLLIEAVYAVNNFTYTTVSETQNINAHCSTITLYAGLKFE